MIELKNVNKTIRRRRILQDITYTFKNGTVYGLHGYNGSGKTMLLRAISGLIRLDDGTVSIDNKVLNQDISFPENMGIVIENMELLPKYSALDNLKLLARIKKIANDADMVKALNRVGLDPNSSLKVKKFSLGMKQRLNIAQAIFENQNIILLDEPTNGLDEEGIKLIYDIIHEESKKGAIIIVATHHKEDLMAFCDVILRISEGMVLEEQLV